MAMEKGRIAYLDPVSGVSGDMLLAALVAVGVSLQDLNRTLDGLGLGLRLTAQEVVRSSIAATKVDVVVGDNRAEEHSHSHPHRGLEEICAILDSGRLHPHTREGAGSVFRCLAEAEGRIHGMAPEKVHFHEVGALDAIGDIVAVVEGFRLLGLESFECGPLPVSPGMTRAAHGRIPLPAPATLELLTGFPLRPGPDEFEMVTPTGAALVRHLATPAQRWPGMIPERIGYGAGTKDTEHPNVLRLILGRRHSGQGGDGFDGARIARDLGLEWGECVLLECNIDDMNPEVFGHVQELLFKAGALDVFLTPLYMKKQRPGTMFSVLCTKDATSPLMGLIIEETTTIGVRGRQVSRWTCRREMQEVSTPYGGVRVKVAYAHGKTVNVAPEYEDCRRASLKAKVPLKTVQRAALLAWEERNRVC